MTISSVKLRQGTGSSTIADGAVTNAKIADGAVTSAKIADGSIVDADVNASAAISPSKISGTAVVTADARLSDTRTPTDGSVSSAKIVDGAVTNAKLQNASITLNGSPVSLGGSATITGLPAQTGNSGKYLTTDGSSASWATVAGGSSEQTYTNNFMMMGA